MPFTGVSSKEAALVRVVANPLTLFSCLCLTIPFHWPPPPGDHGALQLPTLRLLATPVGVLVVCGLVFVILLLVLLLF
jgi:hypothetical protein